MSMKKLGFKSTLVLVISIIVLLVILVTVYLWLTQKGKLTNQSNSLYTTPTTNTTRSTLEGFTIQLPQTWSTQGSVFMDSNNKKIGEYSPGKVTLIDSNVTCNEYLKRVVKGGDVIYTQETNLSFVSAGAIKSVEQKVVTINGTTWYLLVASTLGSLYPHIYCTQDNQKLFLITFYENSLPAENTQIIQQILSTFRFLDLEENYKHLCEEIDGRWNEEYSECESESAPELTNDWCINLNGNFSECESACRHNPKLKEGQVGCIAVCMKVCKW